MKLKPFTTLFYTFIILGIVSFSVSSSLFFFMQKNNVLFEEASIITMLAFFAFTSFSMAFALTPTTLVAIITGHFFPWYSLFFLAIAYMFAATIGLLFFKQVNTRLYKYIHEENKKFAVLVKGLEEKEFLLVLFVRLSPIFPFAIMNLILSTLKIKWRDYLLGSLFGMIPRTIIFFIAGKNANDIWSFILSPSLKGAQQLAPIGLIIISIFGLVYIFKNILEKEKQNQTNKKF